MDKHFTITIHDENGVKQFNVHNFLKKGLYYTAALLLFIACVAIGTILYLDSTIDEIERKRDDIEGAYRILQEKNSELRGSIHKTNIRLVERREELSELSESLKEIEYLMGITPVSDASLKERVSATKMDSTHRATLMQLIPNGSPISYEGITSKFGYRVHPTLKTKEFHRGSDMKAKMNTAVYATADAIVEYAGMHKKSGFGNLVILVHSYGFKSYYAHLNKVVIKSGTFVKKGQLIAYTGNSGLSNGPHLHYEIRFLHKALNPFYFIKWTKENYNDIFTKEKKVPWQSLVTATAHLKVNTLMQTQPSLQQEQK